MNNQPTETFTIRILNIKEELKTHPWLATWGEPYAYYVGRAMDTNVKFKNPETKESLVVNVKCEQSPLANPYKVTKEVDRDKKIDQYALWLEEKLSDPMGCESDYLDKAVNHLVKHKVVNLACWCAPKRCHAEVVADYVVKRVQEYYSLESPTTQVKVDVVYVPTQKAVKTASRLLQPVQSESEFENLRLECVGCQKCELHSERIHSVWSRGNNGKGLMIVGEAPGQNENELALPFIGESGKMLEVMLSSVGLDSQRDSVIVNAVKCRPPENRDPTAKEVDSCFEYLQQQIAWYRPKVILALGKVSTRRLLGLGQFKITAHRGKQYKLDLSKWKLGESDSDYELLGYLEEVVVVPSYHPAYLLRNPENDIGGIRWQSWTDLILVRHLLG